MSRRPWIGSGGGASVLIDTDVLIWTLRGHRGAAKAVDGCEDRAVSVVTTLELLQGARDRREARLIRSFLDDLGFATLPLTENIGHRAVVYMEEHGLSSGLRAGDALIAATAVENGLALLSGDRRHYAAVAGLTVVPFKP